MHSGSKGISVRAKKGSLSATRNRLVHEDVGQLERATSGTKVFSVLLSSRSSLQGRGVDVLLAQSRSICTHFRSRFNRLLQQPVTDPRTAVDEESSSEVSTLLGGVLREIIGLELDGLGMSLVFSEASARSSVFGTALFVRISSGSSESRYCCGPVRFCCQLMTTTTTIQFVQSVGVLCVHRKNGARTVGEESSEEAKHFAKRMHAVCPRPFRSAGKGLGTSGGGSRSAAREKPYRERVT
jgi:hypothetical protein